jgi:uncharacterized membrane protein
MKGTQMKHLFWTMYVLATAATFLFGFMKTGIAMVSIVTLIYLIAIVGGYFMSRSSEPAGKSQSYPGWEK